MADTGTGQILVTKVISPIQSYDRGTDSLHEEVGHLSRERTLSVGRSMSERGGEQESAQSKMIVVIEQWICLVLGFICMAFAMWGICMKPGQDALSEHLAWLGSLYMPTLRATAVVYTGIGRDANTLGMGASLTAFNLQQPEDYRGLLAGTGVSCRYISPLGGQF